MTPIRKLDALHALEDAITYALGLAQQIVSPTTSQLREALREVTAARDAHVQEHTSGGGSLLPSDINIPTKTRNSRTA